MEQKVQHSLVQSLRRIPDFATLDYSTLLQIVGESMNLFWKAGSVIFEPGAPGDALYVVLLGEVSITDDSQEIAHMSAGDSFGEMSLLMNATHTKTSFAVTDSEILVLPKESFETILQTNPALSEHFHRVAAAKRPRELTREL